MNLAEHAYKLLKNDPDLIADAKAGVRVGNTIVGSIMSITLQAPRQYTEQAVAEALQMIKTKRARK